MTEKTYTIADMLGSAASADAAEFQLAFDQLASARAADAVVAAREDVAKTFTPEDSETEEVTDEDAESIPAA